LNQLVLLQKTIDTSQARQFLPGKSVIGGQFSQQGFGPPTGMLLTPTQERLAQLSPVSAQGPLFRTAHLTMQTGSTLVALPTAPLAHCPRAKAQYFSNVTIWVGGLSQFNHFDPVNQLCLLPHRHPAPYSSSKDKMNPANRLSSSNRYDFMALC
jgi:hypothetical protein